LGLVLGLGLERLLWDGPRAGGEDKSRGGGGVFFCDCRSSCERSDSASDAQGEQTCSWRLDSDGGGGFAKGDGQLIT
jgi:hypothetical protein